MGRELATLRYYGTALTPGGFARLIEYKLFLYQPTFVARDARNNFKTRNVSSLIYNDLRWMSERILRKNIIFTMNSDCLVSTPIV